MTCSALPDQTRHDAFRSGLCDAIPISLGVGIYGLAFGILAAGQGLSAAMTGFMSAFVFAGAGQIVALERLGTSAGAMIALVAGLALNLRLLLMTASLRDELGGRPLWQIVLGLHLTADENWVLMHAARNRGVPAGYHYLLGAGVSLFLAWVAATTAGAAFSGNIPDLGTGVMDFAFTAAFILLLTSLWQRRGDLAPWMISASIAALWSLVLPFDPSWGLIFGAIVGAAYAGVRSHD